MLVSGFPQKSGFPLIEGLPPGFFLVRDVDSSIPNTGFISVPRSDSVAYPEMAHTYAVILLFFPTLNLKHV